MLFQFLCDPDSYLKKNKESWSVGELDAPRGVKALAKFLVQGEL